MIEKRTLSFLKDLKLNNNRDWFLANKVRYEAAKENFTSFMQELINGVSKYDKSLKGLEAKKCIFRINRDIRFSADKSPYKSNLGASFSGSGRNMHEAGYYLYIEGNKGFLAGGKWMPEAPQLAAIRQEIDYHSKEFHKIIEAKDFVSFYGGLSQEEKLKTAPKGYPKDHPDLELLKLKSFIVVHDYKSSEITSPDFLASCIHGCRLMMPLNSFLNKGMS